VPDSLSTKNANQNKRRFTKNSKEKRWEFQRGRQWNLKEGLATIQKEKTDRLRNGIKIQKGITLLKGNQISELPKSNGAQRTNWNVVPANADEKKSTMGGSYRNEVERSGRIRKRPIPKARKRMFSGEVNSGISLLESMVKVTCEASKGGITLTT